jgi:hypothetical protein
MGDPALVVKPKGPVMLARGVVLTVALSLPDMSIKSPAVDTILWIGDIGNASFVVTAPPDAAAGPRPGCALISANGWQVARIDFTLTVQPRPAPAACLLPGKQSRHRKAFASYAEPDLDAVLARIQGMQKIAPALNIFVDVLSLRSGQSWKEELWKAIPASDVFYLFWSAHAKRSRWVEKEWRCALQTRGLSFIDPVPLVSPDKVPPPPELSDRHFNDWQVAFMQKNPN